MGRRHGQPSTWQLDTAVALPDFEVALRGVDVERECSEETSTWFDTTDGALIAVGAQCRRDAERRWSVEVPVADGVVAWSSVAAESLPATARALLTGITFGEPLTDVATAHITRTRLRVVSRTRPTVFADITDDHVRATDTARPLEPLAWRRLTVTPGPDGSPKRLRRSLLAAGAAEVPDVPVLQRTLRWTGDATTRPAPDATSAAATVEPYLREQVQRIVDGDIRLRRGEDPVRATRAAVRRLRSTLAVFGATLDGDRVGDVDTELRWFSGLLGEVRDAVAQQRWFDAALTTVPVTDVLGPVRAGLFGDLRATEVRARATLAEVLDGDRYLALLATLRAWQVRPPLRDGATVGEVRRAVEQARRRADAKLVAGVAGTDEQLHRARRAARTARFAAELAAPISGSARRDAIRRRRVQTVLGEHRDASLAAATARRVGVRAGVTSGENGFTFGMLYARAGDAVAAARDRARDLA